MSWRAYILFAALLPGLAGCASNRPLLSADGPLFGHGGGMARAGEVWQAPSPSDAVVYESAAPPEETIIVQESMPVEEPPVVHTVAQDHWAAPDVLPAALTGPKAVAESDGPYLLDSGDRLRIFVYGQPNLSRTYIVDHAGQIPIPLIGTVSARGLTTKGLASVIRDRLGAEFVRDPQVTVDILQNRPFFILGEVRNAGQYPYVSGMTVETAVAIAGGYTERASTRSFRITRRIDGLVEEIDAPSDYVVKAGDTVFVYERFF